MGKPGPISIALCVAAAVVTFFVSVLFLPAAELIPAQVYPEKRTSGESFVPFLPGADDLMRKYANGGVEMLKSLPTPPIPDELKQKDLVKEWETQLIADHGEKYGKELRTNIEAALGGPDNLKKVLELMNTDKNFVYNAYALFLGFALLAGAVAIQFMGRWGAEEKTILPAKK